jgi:hypothetical protein
MFRTDRSIIRRIKRFNRTSSLWHHSRSLSVLRGHWCWIESIQHQRPRKTDNDRERCQRLLVRLKRLILLMMDRSVRNMFGDSLEVVGLSRFPDTVVVVLRVPEGIWLSRVALEHTN